MVHICVGRAFGHAISAMPDATKLANGLPGDFNRCGNHSPVIAYIYFTNTFKFEFAVVSHFKRPEICQCERNQ